MTGLTAAKHQENTNQAIRRLTITAFFAALITLFTAYIFHIPVGINGGYIHLGDAMIYLAAAVLPMPYACAAAAIGGGLADLLTAPVWAPATIIIKVLICVSFSSKDVKVLTKRNIAALFAGLFITPIGYFIAEGIMFGFKTAFFVSISGNVIQALGSAVIFVIIGSALDKMKFKTSFGNRI